MSDQLREIKFLKLYASISTLLFLALFIWLHLTKQGKTSELTLERLNIVESNGQLALIISNGEKIDEGKHRRYMPQRFHQGMLFFNNKGEECGGFIFGSEENDTSYSSFQHLSFDQYNGDQNLVLSQYQEDGYHFKGLVLQDYPDDSVSIDYQRVFDSVYVAEGENQEAWNKARAIAFSQISSQNRLEKRRLIIGSENTIPKVQLNDKNSRPRIRIYVDSTDNPLIEFLNEQGEVISRLPNK